MRNSATLSDFRRHWPTLSGIRRNWATLTDRNCVRKNLTAFLKPGLDPKWHDSRPAVLSPEGSADHWLQKLLPAAPAPFYEISSHSSSYIHHGLRWLKATRDDLVIDCHTRSFTCHSWPLVAIRCHWWTKKVLEKI
jgi:hypothetical protein